MKQELKKRVIEVDAAKLIQKLGNDIEIQEIKKILEKLFFKVEIDGNILKITIPFYRDDITMSDDILEEVARIYGYNNIVSKNLEKNLKSKDLKIR